MSHDLFDARVCKVRAYRQGNSSRSVPAQALAAPRLAGPVLQSLKQDSIEFALWTGRSALCSVIAAAKISRQ